MTNWHTLVFAFLFLASATAAARPRQIEFVNVPASIIGDMRKKLPQVFQPSVTYAELDQLSQSLMESGLFEDLSIESSNVGNDERILVTGRPLRRVQAFTITGNKELSRSEIVEALGLQVGEIFQRKKMVDGAERLKTRYGELGYLNASIEILFEVTSDYKIQVNVVVVEGTPCLIQDIVIETPNKSLQEALMRRAGRNLQKPLTEQRVNSLRDTLNTYFSANRYLNALLSPPTVEYNDEKTQATIIFKLENPLRYEFIFDGNQTLTGPTLLRTLDLENYPRTTLNPPLDIANRLTEIYRDRGYAFAQIDYKEKSFDKAFLRRIYFKIKENKRVRIANIEVVGRLSRGSSYYADFAEEHSTELLGNGYYNRQALDLGLKNLQIELQNQGFLKAKVMAVRTNFSDDKKSAYITINLDEGPQTKIREIVFKGNKTFSGDILKAELKIGVGQPLRLPDLETSIAAIKTYYASLGYLEMALLNENRDLVQYNEDNTEANILFDIREGPQIRVARIVIDGNQLTKDYVIRREIDFNEGDTLTPEHINESTGRLQRLGLFSQVSISTVEQGTDIGERTVVISLVEGNPGLFTSGLGFTDEANLTYRGYLGLAYRNIGGGARAVSSRVELNYASHPRINYLENKIQLGYFEPFIFNTRNRARMTYTHAQFVTDYQFDRGTVMIQQSDDARVFIERDLSLHTKLTWTLYGLERSHFFEKNNLTPESDRFIATIGPTLDVDYRDNPFNPMAGSFSRFSTEYSDPVLGSDDTIRYLKSDAQYTKYHRPFSGSRLIWANQVRGGYITNLSNKEGSGVPFEKSFFLGGRSSVRGYEPATERFPRSEELNYTNDPNFLITNWVMPSRSQYFMVKSEFRFPIYGNFGGAVFYDGGAVYVDGIPIEDPYRDSVGAGLRFSTPVGPVNLEVGYKLDRKTKFQESPSRLHFSIGTF